MKHCANRVRFAGGAGGRRGGICVHRDVAWYPEHRDDLVIIGDTDFGDELPDGGLAFGGGAVRGDVVQVVTDAGECAGRRCGRFVADQVGDLVAPGFEGFDLGAQFSEPGSGVFFIHGAGKTSNRPRKMPLPGASLLSYPAAIPILLLAATADDLQTAMNRIRLLAYAILDGTLIPIDRVHHQKPYYSGKHRRHGMNVQIIADAAGRLVWASAALPGSTHDLTAARTHNIIAQLTRAEVMTFADKAYQGAGGTVRTPFKRHRYRPKLSARQKAVNKVHARIRARGERAVATLKTWKLLAKLRCSPSRTTAIVQAILVLHHVENPIYRG